MVCLTMFLTLYHSNSPAFTEYFNSFYYSHIEQWATCYRIGTPMNTNMYSESFHRVLKIVYLRHKHNRRIDYLVHILLKIARDKAFEQLQKLEKGKHTHRICDINKRHKTAVSFAVLAKIEVEGNNAYRVNSQSRQGLSYIVKRMKQSWFCSACAHMYTCTCLDACTNTTACKHMHLIHMQSQSVCGTSLTSSTTDLEYYSRISASPIPVLSSQPASDTVIKKIEKKLQTYYLSAIAVKTLIF